ncbi:MAG: cupin, partial [Proteobacteria bacterium]|nr:cupin [Pseudomonadota bacterium]
MPTPVITPHWLSDDGLVPNNALAPLLLYRAGLPLGSAPAIEAHFARNGWSNAWVNGIYPFH